MYTCKGASVAALAVKCSQTSSNLHQNTNQKYIYLQIPRPGIIKLKCALTSSQMGKIGLTEGVYGFQLVHVRSTNLQLSNCLEGKRHLMQVA